MPPPMPPKCQLELFEKSQCNYRGANKITCGDHYYSNADQKAWMQCAWVDGRGCKPGGFICSPEDRGTANCNCPSRCPLEVQAGHCRHQDATRETCAEHFYQLGDASGVWRQCEWDKSGYKWEKCKAGGYQCDPKGHSQDGSRRNCKCPSKCPNEIQAGRCQHQDADAKTCDNFFYETATPDRYKQCEWDSSKGVCGPKQGGPICEREKESRGSECFTCLPRSPKPSPPPPSPPPMPPKCQLELSDRMKCYRRDVGSKTCSDYYYKVKFNFSDTTDRYKQCKWGTDRPGESKSCEPGGLDCNPTAQGTANCNCPSVCPYKILEGQCYNQGATQATCSDYHYKKDGVWNQCKWNPLFDVDGAKCRMAGGPICERKGGIPGSNTCSTCLPHSPSPPPPSSPPPTPPPPSSPPPTPPRP